MLGSRARPQDGRGISVGTGAPRERPVRRALTPVFVLFLLALAPCSAAAACVDCLRAGAARGAPAVPAGTPLAGYGALDRRLLVPDVLGRHPHAFWFKPSEGTLDPLAA